MLKYICAALLLLDISSFCFGSHQDFYELTGCTDEEYGEGTRDYAYDLLLRCPNFFAFMSNFEDRPILPEAQMPKARVCSVPEETDECIRRYIGYLPCLKEEYKRAVYVAYNITQKVAEVYCEDYQEIEKDRMDGLLSCSNVPNGVLKQKIRTCIPEHNNSGVCNGISSALRCIREEAFADCSDTLKLNAKGFLQKVMDAVETCPRVEI